jgi:acyl-CoA hydrolase
MLERIEAGRVTESRVLDMVPSGQATACGVPFGAEVQALMIKAAYLVASRFARLPFVLVSTERLETHSPVKEEQIIEIVSRVAYTGRTSVTLDVDLYAEELLTGERSLSRRGRIVFVALDGIGRPAAVPRLSVTTSQPEVA